MFILKRIKPLQLWRSTYTFNSASSRIDLKPETCYYKVLNVPAQATVSQIRRAYLELVKRYHPDINRQPDANERFARINKAYEILSQEDTRRQYDEANSLGRTTGSASTAQEPDEQKMSAEQLKREMQRIKEEHLNPFNQLNQRKDQLNDEYNFSYKLMKDHFEKITVKKEDYIKYHDGRLQYYEHKDAALDPWYKQYLFVIFPVGVFLGYKAFGGSNDEKSEGSLQETMVSGKNKSRT